MPLVHLSHAVGEVRYYVKWDKYSWDRGRPRFARRGLSDRKENGTANHTEHAKGGGALQGQDDALDLKARLAEIE